MIRNARVSSDVQILVVLNDYACLLDKEVGARLEGSALNDLCMKAALSKFVQHEKARSL